MPRRGHARFDREGAGVQEAHPDVHRPHAGDDVPGSEATKHGAVPGLGESLERGRSMQPVVDWCWLRLPRRCRRL